MNIATLTMTLGLSLAISGTSAAERYELGLSGGMHFVPMESMDAVSEDMSYEIATLHAGIKVPELSLLTGFETEVGLNWDFGELRGTTFNRISAGLETDALTASARLRRQLRGPFSVFADAGLGIVWARLRLEDQLSSSGRPLAGKAKALLSSLGGGAELRVLDHENFRFALRTEIDYEVATSMSFAATPMKSGEDKLEIATASADLGSINTSGLVFRFGFVGSF